MSVVSGEYLRVSMNFKLGDGTQYQNIYHYLRDGPDPYSDAEHIAVIQTAMNLAYADLASLVLDDVVEQLNFVDKVAWNLPLASWRVVANIGTFTIPFTPSEAGDGLPYTVSPFVVFKTIRPRTVGKKFLFPLGEIQQNESILIGGAVTALTAYATEILLDIVLAGANVLIPGVVRTGVEEWLSFQTAVITDILGSQKRRRPGVGA